MRDHGDGCSCPRPLAYGPNPFGTAEAVDAHAALKSYTASAARQIKADDRAGDLTVGKSADLAIWDRNPYTVSTDALKDMVREMTLFQGVVVFDRSAQGL